MTKKIRALGILSGVLLLGSAVNVFAEDDPYTGWKEADGKYYWYENGVQQGLEGRGKEIYDPSSDAWYWLDAVQNGAMTVDKDVYQDSLAGFCGERLDDNGQKVGKWVRYDSDGHMIKGWSKDGRYYFDPVYGSMAKGYYTIDGTEYYFDTDTGECQGIVQENIDPEKKFWRTIDGRDIWYENGQRQGYSIDPSYRGKEIFDEDSKAWYWLDNAQDGAKAVSQDVYQESAAGYMGEYSDENGEKFGKWVRYDENGHMIKGWSEDGMYYFDPVYGTMFKYGQIVDHKRCIFHPHTGILLYEEPLPLSTYDDIKVNDDEVYRWGIFGDIRWIISKSDSALILYGYWDEQQINFKDAEYIEYADAIEKAYVKIGYSTDLSYLFYNLENLRSVEFKHFDTSKVTDMSHMFDGCESLTDVDLSSFDTHNVTDMSHMFNGCKSLTSVDLSSFDTSNVKNMNSMFSNTTQLSEIIVSDGWKVNDDTETEDMFAGCGTDHVSYKQ